MIRHFQMIVLGLLATLGTASAQEGGVVPVQVVDGRLVVACDFCLYSPGAFLARGRYRTSAWRL